MEYLGNSSFMFWFGIVLFAAYAFQLFEAMSEGRRRDLQRKAQRKWERDREAEQIAAAKERAIVDSEQRQRRVESLRAELRCTRTRLSELPSDDDLKDSLHIASLCDYKEERWAIFDKMKERDKNLKRINDLENEIRSGQGQKRRGESAPA
jgi:hypothetical protein